MSINRVMISGNLTRDAELRTTPNGMMVLNLGVAFNERRRDQNGEWKDYPNYIDCTMFGTRAEKIAPYLEKGVKVAIEGRLHYSAWEDRNSGQKRSKLNVTVDEIEFMSRQQQQQPQQQAYPQDTPPMMQPQQVSQPQQSMYANDDIPF